jgi:hypothetical protein
MAETLNFGEAVQRAGISRHRLNQAITSGRLPAVRGGGPGKPTTIQLEDLQAWCLSEGLAMPVEMPARLERSGGPELVTLIRWMDQMSTTMARVEATLERLERSQPAGNPAVASEACPPAAPVEEISAGNSASAPDRAAILHRLHAMQAKGFSLQAMADRFNLEGVPTLSGKGQWRKGTIGKLLAQRDETR